MLARSVWVSALLLMLGCGSSLTNETDGAGGENAGGGAPASGGNNTGASAATGGGGASCVTPDEVGAFAIGTGEKCFETLHDGDTVPLMAGPQGGYHLWVAAACADCGGSPVLAWGAKDPATGELFPETADSEAVVHFLGGPVPQEAGLILTMPGISWDPENYPPPPVGTHLILWARVDAAGHEAQVEIVIGETKQWDPCAENPNDPLCQTG